MFSYVFRPRGAGFMVRETGRLSLLLNPRLPAKFHAIGFA